MINLIEKFLIKIGIPKEPSEVLAGFIYTIILLFISVQLCYGLYQANDKDKCKVSSIIDVVISPAYALGCNLNKDRFDIKLN